MRRMEVRWRSAGGLPEAMPVRLIQQAELRPWLSQSLAGVSTVYSLLNIEEPKESLRIIHRMSGAAYEM